MLSDAQLCKSLLRSGQAGKMSNLSALCKHSAIIIFWLFYFVLLYGDRACRFGCVINRKHVISINSNSVHSISTYARQNAITTKLFIYGSRNDISGIPKKKKKNRLDCKWGVQPIFFFFKKWITRCFYKKTQQGIRGCLRNSILHENLLRLQLLRRNSRSPFHSFFSSFW